MPLGPLLLSQFGLIGGAGGEAGIDRGSAQHAATALVHDGQDMPARLGMLQIDEAVDVGEKGEAV
ncbi:hypothetical protein GCM10007858_04610 [Bradyrhizobium liaoningense]|nr:hypothetical protein GCM10007858_04610 [Bradyrhizobium liaoningense]